MDNVNNEAANGKNQIQIRNHGDQTIETEKLRLIKSAFNLSKMENLDIFLVINDK